MCYPQCLFSSYSWAAGSSTKVQVSQVTLMPSSLPARLRISEVYLRGPSHVSLPPLHHLLWGQFGPGSPHQCPRPASCAGVQGYLLVAFVKYQDWVKWQMLWWHLRSSVVLRNPAIDHGYQARFYFSSLVIVPVPSEVPLFCWIGLPHTRTLLVLGVGVQFEQIAAVIGLSRCGDLRILHAQHRQMRPPSKRAPISREIQWHVHDEEGCWGERSPTTQDSVGTRDMFEPAETITMHGGFTTVLQLTEKHLSPYQNSNLSKSPKITKRKHEKSPATIPSEDSKCSLFLYHLGHCCRMLAHALAAVWLDSHRSGAAWGVGKPYQPSILASGVWISMPLRSSGIETSFHLEGRLRKSATVLADPGKCEAVKASMPILSHWIANSPPRKFKALSLFDSFWDNAKAVTLSDCTCQGNDVGPQICRD